MDRAAPLTLLLLTVASFLQEGKCNLDEERLVHDLLHNSNPDVPPGGPNNPITVGVGLTLVDTAIQGDVLDARAWLMVTWPDKRLKWTPSEYGDIKTIRLANSKVWLPDIVHYNNLDVNEQRYEDCLVVVQPSGDVLWIPKTKYQQRCLIEGDTYNCSATFGSWTYSADRVDIGLYNDSPKIDVEFYKPPHNFDFELTTSTLERFGRKYPCCDEIYPSIQASLIFKKK